MKVLVACEESQRVCIAFRNRGFEAYSCDIQPCSGGHPEWHCRGDVLPLLDGNCSFLTESGAVVTVRGGWDLVIAHPPCTYLTVAGNRWFEVERYGDSARQRFKDRYSAIVFFMQMTHANAEHIAVENPIGVMNTSYREADQIINPFEFGHPVGKSTCLWLKNLPKLIPTDIVEPERIHSKGRTGGYSGASWYAKDENGKAISWNDPRTAKERSKTFEGIAEAMAQQWGDYILSGAKEPKQLSLFDGEVIAERISRKEGFDRT